MELIKHAWYKNTTNGEERSLSSWGEKNVKLGMGFKLIGDRPVTREEFERDWILVDPKPYDAD